MYENEGTRLAGIGGGSIIYGELGILLSGEGDDMKFGGFKAQQDYYTVALIGKYYADRVDFQKIWNTQELSEDLIALIPDLADFVWEHFQNPTVQGVNTGQWCKKEDCWTLLQERFEHSEFYAKREV